MSIFFKELNLPIPVDDLNKEKILNIKRTAVLRPYLFLSRTPEEFLSNEIIDIFSKINIFPDTLIVFGHVDDINYESSKSLVHSDIIFADNSWKKVPFAINWELENINPILKWWDTSTLMEVYPEDFYQKEVFLNNDLFRYGQGIHYGRRKNTDTSQMNCLEQHILKKYQAVMIRTEIPHSVYYKSGFESRTSISLRFPIDKIPSWEVGLKTFECFVNKS